MRNKLTEVTEHVLNSQIAVVTESKLDNTFSNASLEVEGYHLIRCDRDSRGGGVACYIARSLQPLELVNLSSRYQTKGMETVVVRVEDSERKPLTVIGLYRPPQVPASYFGVLSDLLLECSDLGYPLLLLGDLNADLCKPTAYPAKSLLESLSAAGMECPGEAEPTRITATSSTCIDLIAVDSSIAVLSYQVLHCAASDHCPVTAIIGRPCPRATQPILSRNLNHRVLITLEERVRAIPVLDRNAEMAVSQWSNDFLGALDEVAPLKPKPLRKRLSPFVTEQTKNLMLERDFLLRRIRQLKNNSNVTLAEDSEQRLKVLKKRIKSRIRHESKEQGKEILRGRDTGAIWRFLRQASSTTKNYTEQFEDIVKLNDYLAEVVRDPSSTPLSALSTCSNHNSFSFQHLSIDETRRALESVKRKTAPGHDGITSYMLRNLAAALAPTLTRLFNMCIDDGEFPTTWKLANLKAIWKGKGSKADATNYRPISVLPLLARVFEKLLVKQLSHFSETSSIIPESQFGFRPQSSCELALIKMTDSWMRAVDEGKMVGVLLLDLSKAFDTVSHQKLLLKLLDAGLSRDALCLLTSFLQNRRQRVVNGDSMAEWKPVTRGVPQGSCLSPLLFNIYVRDFPCVDGVDMYQYADDTNQSTADSTLDKIAGKLGESFRVTKEYCENNDLLLNCNKTQFIILKQPRKQIPTEFTLQLGDENLQPMLSVKLLGFTIDRHFTFTPHVDSTVVKARAALALIRRARKWIPREMAKLAYGGLVRSILEYCCSIFCGTSLTNRKKLEVVQKIAARIICQAPRDAHAAPLLSGLGLEDLNTRREKHLLSLTYGILQGKTHPAMSNLLCLDDDGSLTEQPFRTTVGSRRFSVLAAKLVNREEGGSVAEITVNNDASTAHF